MILAVLGLVIFAVYCVCRHTPIQSWLVVVVLITLLPLTLILPDLIDGGQRSAIARYWMPAYLGLGLAVAYGLAHQLTQTRLRTQPSGQGSLQSS